MRTYSDQARWQSEIYGVGGEEFRDTSHFLNRRDYLKKGHKKARESFSNQYFQETLKTLRNPYVGYFHMGYGISHYDSMMNDCGALVRAMDS